MQDYYEILQVHPKADHETIQAAYARLAERYDLSRLDGAADELVTIAQQRREEVDQAFAVLGDAERRAAYDQEQYHAAAPPPTTLSAGQATGSADDLDDLDYLTEDDLFDYRPLPPANQQERPSDFNTQPMLTVNEIVKMQKRQSRRSSFWSSPATVAAIMTFVIGFSSLLLTGGGITAMHPPVPNQETQQAMMQGQQGQQGQTPGMDMPSSDQLTSQFEDQIVLAKQAANEAPDNPNAWISLGNTLYDSVQIVYEHMPDSEAYRELLPRWLEASEAYEKALELDPDNAVVRSDMAISLCNYGVGNRNEEYIAQGLAQAQQAFADGPEEGRVLLNLGTCLVSVNPPKTDEALKHWRKILLLPETEQGVVVQAQRMLARYEEQ
jgi:tetratricopeptide (TPR) repeat protein